MSVCDKVMDVRRYCSTRKVVILYVTNHLNYNNEETIWTFQF